MASAVQIGEHLLHPGKRADVAVICIESPIRSIGSLPLSRILRNAYYRYFRFLFSAKVLWIKAGKEGVIMFVSNVVFTLAATGIGE